MRKAFSLIMLAVAAVAGACAAVFAFGAYSADLGIMRIKISAEPARRGETALVAHPVGEITAFTHETPVLLVVELDRIRKDSAEKLIADKGRYEAMLSSMEKQAPLVLEKFFKRILLLAAIGGMLGAIAGRRVRFYNLAAGALIGVVFTGAAGCRIYADYDLRAFDNPNYRGLIEYAPDLVEAVRKSAQKGRNLRQYVRDMANNVSTFYVEMDRYAQKDDGEHTKILHISDIHNNPLSADFIRTLVKGFSPDMILDTGDITDMGTGLEAGMNDSLAGIKQPHFFVSGNHDSPEVVDILMTKYKVRVLRGELVVFHGLRILGYGDPSALKPFKTDEDPGAMEELAANIRTRIEGMKEPPDILMVHNPDVANEIAGLVPLILCGHNHEISVRKSKGTVIVVAGTAGAAGVRYIETKKKPEYSAALITVHSADKRNFVEYVDMIQMNQGTGEFKVQRRMFADEKGAPVLPAAR